MLEERGFAENIGQTNSGLDSTAAIGKPVKVSTEEKIADKTNGLKILSPEVYKKMAVPYGLLILLYLSRYFLGNFLLLFLFFVFTFVITVGLLKILVQFKEIRVDSVFLDNSPWYQRLMQWNTLLSINCIFIASFITIGFFIFYFSIGGLYSVILFLDGIFIFHVNQRLRVNVENHIKSKPAVLINGLMINIINVSILFIFYFIYSLVFERFSVTFVPGILDPSIPVWVQNNIHHSCASFQKLLRLTVALSLSFENLISVDDWIHWIYKIFHLLTMSFFPFITITLFYRYFLEIKLFHFSGKTANGSK
jgi:hypothetical protein